MFLYEGLIVPHGDKFLASVFKLSHDEPECSRVMERECATLDEANIWLDDEMCRLTTSKGIWDV